MDEKIVNCYNTYISPIIENIIEVLTDYHTYTSLFVLFIGILLKILLDLNLGIFIVKNFYWMSFRGIFRNKSNKISGVYKQHWKSNKTQQFNNKYNRQSLITIKQLNNYCYGEFISNEEKYFIFGELINRKIIGHWSDSKSKLGYFGAFEFSIVDQNRIEGLWIGHSNEKPHILNKNTWIFKAVTDNTKFLVLVQLKIYFKRKYRQLKRKL